MTWIKRSGVILFWLAVWQAAYMLIGSDIIFASPADTIAALVRLMGTDEFYAIIGLSFLRTAAGFLAGALTGLALGGLAAGSGTAKALLKPVIDIVRAAPVASFIILALVWIKTGFIPVFISFLTVTPIVWSAVLTGLDNTDQKLLEMAKVFEYSRITKIRKLYIPTLIPYIKTAMVTGAGFAFKSGVAAEIIASPELSIGRSLQEARIYFETAELLAWTAAIIVLSIIFEKLLIRAVGRKNV